MTRIAPRFDDVAGSSTNLESLMHGLRTGSQVQLAAVGIDNPTPQQLNASLNGGTIVTVHGPTTLSGVLQLRSQGMGWGKIAQTVGVHAGMGKGPATALSVAR